MGCANIWKVRCRKISPSSLEICQSIKIDTYRVCNLQDFWKFSSVKLKTEDLKFFEVHFKTLRKISKTKKKQNTFKIFQCKELIKPPRYIPPLENSWSVKNSELRRSLKCFKSTYINLVLALKDKFGHTV